MNDPSKVRPINGENAKAAFTRLLQLAGAAKEGAPGAQPLPSPEIRAFALKLLKTLCADSEEGHQLRAAARQLITAGEQFFAIVRPQGDATRL